VDGWVVVGIPGRHTGAVVDLVVDDHVEVFLREVLVLSFVWYGGLWRVMEGDITLEVCSDTSLKVNSLDILRGCGVLICVVYGEWCKENGTLVE
jgi:hypothetical protein